MLVKMQILRLHTAIVPKPPAEVPWGPQPPAEVPWGPKPPAEVPWGTRANSLWCCRIVYILREIQL